MTGPQLRWKCDVPTRSSAVLSQLGLAIGVPFAIIVVVVALTSRSFDTALRATAVVSLALLVGLLFILAFYRGIYEAEFILDDAGALSRIRVKEERLMTQLPVGFGLATDQTGKKQEPSRQEVFLRWRDVTAVEYRPDRHQVVLSGNPEVTLFAGADNYPQVEQQVRFWTRHLGN